MFQRLDRDKDGFVTPLDILKFLRECNVHLYHEADCYYLIKFFDADEDNQLSYADFLQIILPIDNELLRAFASQKQNEIYIKNIETELPEEVEKELASLIALEIDMHRRTEPLK
jgi:EF-hand domain pair